MTAIARRQELRDRVRPAFQEATRRWLQGERPGVMRMVEWLFAVRLNVNPGLASYLSDRQPAIAAEAEATFANYVDLASRAAQQEVGYSEPVDTTDFLSEYSAAFSRRFTGSLANRVQATADQARENGADPVEAVADFLLVWMAARPAELALEESVRLGDATAREVYRAAGVHQVRWHAVGSSCPYCRALDGRVVGIEGEFLKQDVPFLPPVAASSGRVSWADIEAREALQPLIPSTNVRHPPGHRACDCLLLAA